MMIKDPVCGKEVDMKSNRYRSLHEGNEYWFDTLECKDLFDADPDSYVEKGSAKADHGHKVADIGKKAAVRSKSRARSIFSERKGDAADLAESLSSALNEASRSLRDKEYKETASFIEKAASRINGLSGGFREKDAGEIINEAEDYVRSHPVLAVGGALTAGFLFTRLLKSGESEAGHE